MNTRKSILILALSGAALSGPYARAAAASTQDTSGTVQNAGSATAATAFPAVAAGSGADGRDLAIGGLVTLDQQSRLDGNQDPEMSLRQVALEANVALAGGIIAAVSLKAERDLDHIFFDQAMASLAPEGSPWSLLFGQHTFNHGLSATRLISDPEILSYLEIRQPGATVSYTRGEYAVSLGSALWNTGIPSADPAGEPEESRDYALIPNVDWSRGPVQARLSGMASRYRTDADLALCISYGPVTVDAEAFTQVPAWSSHDEAMGYSVGGQYQLIAPLAVAFRHDAIASSRSAGTDAFRFGGGLVLTLKHDLFAAAEYSYGRGIEAPGHMLALQIGLKSSLTLPGFQRETLSRD